LRSSGDENVSRNGNQGDAAVMTDVDAAARFTELVELKMANKDFLSAEAETALLEDGVRSYGLPLAQARGIVGRVAEQNDVALARELEKGVEQWVKTAGGRNKRLGRKQFDQMVATYETGAHGELSKDEIKKRLKTLMERNDVEPKRAGLLRTRRWYNKI
jgi:hypothetical protein